MLAQSDSMVKATLLEKPLPDKYPEVHFDVVGLGTWVHFEDDEYEDWVGVFGRAYDHFGRDFAVPFSRGGAALVSALGKGYVIDVNQRKLRCYTSSDWLTRGITIPHREFVIASDYDQGLMAIGLDQELWLAKGIASDGIRFVEATSDKLRCLVWHYTGWYSSTLRYDGWIYTPGPVVSYDW